jgi:hypothetical protein
VDRVKRLVSSADELGELPHYRLLDELVRDRLGVPALGRRLHAEAAGAVALA